MMNWRDYWNQDTPLYVNERHRIVHGRIVSGDILAEIRVPDARVLDYGCGEALFADRVARQCGTLYLCDGAPIVRERLAHRYRGEGRIVVLSPEELDVIPDGTLDLIVVNSLLQYLSLEDLRALLPAWRRKLAREGRLVIADVIPPETGPLTDAKALLALGWQGGFLCPAIAGLARTALSDYRKVRETLGLSTYAEADMLDLFREAGFSGRRRSRNFGHNQARATYEAVPL